MFGIASRASRHSIVGRGFSSSSRNGANIAVLCILDGWGYREDAKYNAVLQGNTPNFDQLYGHHKQMNQTGFLNASEKFVGLPDGQIGNSEVGHLTLGSGRVIYQDICRIDMAIEQNTLREQENFQKHIEKLKKSGGVCHVMGLVSPGGVHSMQTHVASLANEVHRNGVPVIVHAFTDGRDVPPQDAVKTMPTFLDSLDDGITVGTVIGRYFAMDRDHRWERVGAAYDAIAQAKGEATAPDALTAISQSYSEKVHDEFIAPTVIGDYKGMNDGDGILMCNFRSDRAREILWALADPNPPEEMEFGTTRPPQPKFATVDGMVEYSDRHNEYMTSIFPPKDIPNTLGETVSKAGLKQLRIAETEKYPHVSFFFNGGREVEYEGEERILVPSPKVATYDLQPSMSAPQVGENLCNAIDSGKYQMAICNFANPDMVGHTGVLPAVIEACETVDKCLGDVIESVKKQKGVLIVTADHGNAEMLWDYENDQPHTAHTLNQVPVIVADYTGEDRQIAVSDGGLSDIAPTLLHVLGIEQPADMTGKSLVTLKE